MPPRTLPAIGIDLGTTNSSVSVVLDGKCVVLPDEAGRLSTPSVVHFPEDGPIVVGHEARSALVRDPINTIYSVKRLIGRNFNDAGVRVARNAVPYAIVNAPTGHAAVRTAHGEFSAAEVSSLILQHLTGLARKHLGEGVLRAVLTVPANFNDAQRELTRIAGRIAGLDVLRIVNEPTAAALAYGTLGGGDGRVAVYDFGGGTFDISLVELLEGSYRVLATAGDNFLGGDDLDLALASELAGRFQRETGIDLRRSQAQWQRLLFASEAAKCELASRKETEVHLPQAGYLQGRAADLRLRVTRDELTAVAFPIVERSMELVERCLRAARLSPQQLTDVLLVGGTTRAPLVGDAVSEFFGRRPRSDLDPMLAVSMGAGIHAAQLTGVALKTGGAPQREALLLDVLPRSIGLAVAGGGVEWILRANTPIPTEERRRYHTWRDRQTEMRFVLLQGDSQLAAENITLGELKLSGLRAASAGELTVELVLEVDVNGFFRATAVDLETGRHQSFSLSSEPGSSLTSSFDRTARANKGKVGP